MSYRLGVDVGGTFTDLALIDESSGRTFRAKTPSTPWDQSEGVMAGILKVCGIAGIAPTDITELMHGTTVATNAVLEGKGAVVGLVTTEGYRQVLQIGRSFVPGGLAGWIVWPKPTPLALLENTVEVSERVGARGEVVRAVLDRSFVDEQGTRWVIDYKTSEHSGGGREAFLDLQVERYRTQLERYAMLARRLGPEPVRVALYFPLMGGWREWAPPSEN